jgi:threonylcarbamoyladenosine tRNA methylthiotransferase CDKAL1
MGLPVKSTLSAHNQEDFNNVNTVKTTRSVRMKQDGASGSGELQRPYLYHLKIFGCSHNQSDGEVMGGLLDEAGFVATEDPDAADIIVLNSCAVKGPGQALILHLVNQYRSTKHVLVAGCIPQSMPELAGLEGVHLLGVQQFQRIVDAVDRIISGEQIRWLSKQDLPSLNLPKRRNNSLVEIIPINLGCLHACTYCKTKHARGHLRSYTIEAIVDRAKSAIAEGAKQIWITSEDAGAYGKDIGVTLPQLLRALLAAIPSEIMVRVGMTNPPYVLEYIDELCDILNHPQMFSFLHVPVQAGSDAVLEHMHRGYSVAEFERAVDMLRKNVPTITVATDIICGYPSETEEDFAKTMALVRKYEFPILYISQFYPRPNTPAAAMRRIPTQDVKRRSTALTVLFKEQQPYASLANTTQDVWVSSTSDDGKWSIGHTKNYIQALLPRDDSLLGKRVSVRVTRAGKHHLMCELQN